MFVGLYHQRKCPKGRHCNFLHVFRNPGDEFRSADVVINHLLVRSPTSERRQTSDRHRLRHQRDYSRSRFDISVTLPSVIHSFIYLLTLVAWRSW